MDAAQKQELRRLFASKLTDAVRMYLETCTHCGTCIPACHAYASEPDLRYSAVGRAENIRKIFKKQFSLLGKTAGWLSEAVDFSDAALEKVYETAYTCTGCRRCVTYCPFGIDTQQIQSIAKLLLIGAGREPQVLSMLADMSIAKGENIEATKASFTEAVKNLQDEVIERWRSEAGTEAIPIGQDSADLLYVALARGGNPERVAEILGEP